MMSTVVYRVRDWGIHFENNRTRELKKLDWVPMPNKHDGDGYSELLDHANGMAHYGAWALIVQVASKCDIRGTLLRDGAKPYNAQSLSRVTRGAAKVFEEALPRLVDIGWLEALALEDLNLTEMSQVTAEIPQDVASSRARATKGREGKRTEGKRIEGNGKEGNRSESIREDSPSLRFEKVARELVKPIKPNGWDPLRQQSELEELCLEALGKDEMARWGSRWRDRAEKQPGLLKRVLAELRVMQREGTTDVRNPGAAAEDLWKRFT